MRTNKVKNEALKDKIIADACKHFKVTEKELKDKSNVGELSLARQVVYYLLFTESGYTHEDSIAVFHQKHTNRSAYAVQAITRLLRTPLENQAKKVIKFFRIHGYCADRYKPYLKLERSVA